MIETHGIARPLTLRGVRIRNRLWMSPMAQYSATVDGNPTDWHTVHYGSRAVGGVGMVMVESTAIGPEDRCTIYDPGLWNDEQVAAHQGLTAVIRDAGAVPAVQLQAAGRKSSHREPWVGSGQNSALSPDDGGWTTIAPSPVPFGKLATPHPLTAEEIDEAVARFARAATRAHLAGYDVVEIHAAHGYLLHQFLSPITNHREDEFGGSLDNRMRFPLAVAAAVRDAFPADKPVFVRLTATDWVEGGITVEEAIEFTARLREVGIDLVDVTSGGLLVDVPPPPTPAVNVASADRIREATGMAVAPVGQVGDPAVLDDVFERSAVDAVFIGRPLLRDPYFALRVFQHDAPREMWPAQYHRAV